MAGLRNKRLQLSGPEYLTAIVFVAVLLVGAYFYKCYLDVRDLYNLENTSVDFIVSAPNQEQLNEISARPDVDSIVPYVFRSVEVEVNKKTIETSLVLIEDSSQLEHTVFADELVVDIAEVDSSPIYVSEDFADAARLHLCDELNLAINGNVVRYTVAGIYKSDHRNVGGTVIAVIDDDVISALGGSYKYSGAYICSNSVADTRGYLEDYQALGDIRDREEFDSDEAYQIYLDSRSTKDTNAVFDCEAYLRDIGKRNDPKLLRNIVLTIVIVVVAYALVTVSNYSRLKRYIIRNVGKDIKNNFTLKQERQMLNRFCMGSSFLFIICFALVVVVSYFIFGINAVQMILISGIVLIIIIELAIGVNSTRRLNKEFAMQIKENDEGRMVVSS